MLSRMLVTSRAGICPRIERFDLVAKLRGFFDARSGARAMMDL